MITAKNGNRKTEAAKTLAFILVCCCLFVLPSYASPEWNTQEGADNAQGDQKKTGKTQSEAQVPVHGAIGNLDDRYSMDIDGDGTADITIPEADLIEVTVTPSVLVNVYRKEANSGEDIRIASTSAEGIIKNENKYNKLKVSFAGLEPLNEHAGNVTVTEELDQNASDNLSLSIYAEDTAGNAFTKSSDGIKDQILPLANITQTPPVPITMGTLTEKGGQTPSGRYRFKANCRSAFVDKYKDQMLTYKAVYKFTIEN